MTKNTLLFGPPTREPQVAAEKPSNNRQILLATGLNRTYCFSLHDESALIEIHPGILSIYLGAISTWRSSLIMVTSRLTLTSIPFGFSTDSGQPGSG